MGGTRQKRPLRFGIQARVLTLAVAFTLVTAAVILVSGTRSLSAQLRRSVLQSAEYAIQTAADGIGQDIREIDALPSWCAVNYTVRAALFSDFSPGTLAQTAYPFISNRYGAMRTALYIQRFLIVNSSGRTIMLGTATSQSKAVDATSAARFPGMGEGDGPVAWDRLADDPLMQSAPAMTGIPVVRSISNSGGATARIYLSVSPALITDALKGLDTQDGSWLCWVMGGRLYRVEEGALTDVGALDQLLAPEDRPSDTLDAGTLLRSAQFDGEGYSMVLCPLGAHDLYLGQAIPDRRTTHSLTLLRGPALVSLVAVLVMGLVIAALLRRVVARPIGALQRRIEAVSRGDFSPDPSIEWDHELGDVGRGVNRLSQSVSELMVKRLEDEQQRLALEYRMLQSQISPHFIYNTLNSIRWMATIQHAPGVAEMVTALSRLLKSVSKGNQKLVPLHEEFALLEDYFTIQRYRYGGTIALEMPELDQEDDKNYRIPRFTLQPLAENAIFHGIEPNGGMGKLSVTVAHSPDSQDLLIRLTDDGVGMDPEQVDLLLRGTEEEDETVPFRHLGIRSVHRLLQLSFGPDYGLTVDSRPSQGTAVTMRLPRRSPEETGG